MKSKNSGPWSPCTSYIAILKNPSSTAGTTLGCRFKVRYRSPIEFSDSVMGTSSKDSWTFDFICVGFSLWVFVPSASESSSGGSSGSITWSGKSTFFWRTFCLIFWRCVYLRSAIPSKSSNNISFKSSVLDTFCLVYFSASESLSGKLLSRKQMHLGSLHPWVWVENAERSRSLVSMFASWFLKRFARI